jgi:Lectin C-type domain
MQLGMQLASFKNRSEIESSVSQLETLGKGKNTMQYVHFHESYEYKFNKSAGLTSFWVSASDEKQPAGQYQWVDGTAVNAKLWRKGEPNSWEAGRTTCVYLYLYKHNELGDSICTEAGFNALCQLPLSLIHCLLSPNSS